MLAGGDRVQRLRTYAGIVSTRPDDELDLTKIQKLLLQIVEGIGTAPNAVRYAMNGFVIAVGTYAKPPLRAAKRAARTIAAVAGDTARAKYHLLRPASRRSRRQNGLARNGKR